VIEKCDIPPIHNGADAIAGRKACQDFGAKRDQTQNAEHANLPINFSALTKQDKITLPSSSS
jgi:hypothetical protein